MITTLRLLAAALVLAVPGLAHAERMLALVIGINDYRHVTPLDGARADALDIATALRSAGASRVVTLTDGEASKSNVTRAWQTLLAEAGRGDVIFFSYAGHGAQVPQRAEGDERDAKDEFWVLPGFDPRNVRQTMQETIFDNELHRWFTDASQRGVRVVLVSDSCHAGGMDRAVSGKLRFVALPRQRLLAELFASMLNSAATPAADAGRLPPNVTLLAATSEALPVPEVIIDGAPRGALSWSVARALEGRADRDDDGAISRQELEDYIFATVRMRSEALQTPVFTPLVAPSGEDRMLTLKLDATLQMAAAPVDPNGRKRNPPARDLGFTAVLPLSVKGSAEVIERTVTGAFPYEWDAARGIFKTPNGEVGGDNISAYTVNDVVSKFILLDFLKTIASTTPGFMSIAPEKQVYLAGERIKFTGSHGAYRNMLVFNLANTGEVQYIDMVINGEPSRGTFLREIQVVAPFGSDHIVAIYSNEDLEAIGRAIERGVSAKELLQLMTQRIDATDTAISILPIYTRKS
jgi:hypothetical protein